MMKNLLYILLINKFSEITEKLKMEELKLMH